VSEADPSPASGGFLVEATGLPDLHQAGQQLVFHGINKSGSLTLTNVLADAYYAANRANQFFSTYLSVPKSHDKIRQVISHSTGHAFFGGHYLYDSYGGRSADRVLVTQFRHPLPRVRSCYQWHVNKHGLSTPFEQWVLDTRGVLHSQIAQFGIGYAPDAPDWRTVSGAEVLDRAITRIEKDVTWFGLAEYFEETVFMMAALCGLEEVGPWVRDTRNQDRPLVTEWPQHEIDLVRDVFRWDFELYAWALNRFQDVVAGIGFGPDLARYKTACRAQYNDRLSLEGQPIT
jgi:hypothetical protein